MNYDIEIVDGKVVTFRGWDNFDGNVVIPDGVTAICNCAFESAFCGIKSVHIPSTVTKIGNSAFSYCEELQEIIIPEGVISIGEKAFHDCHSLKRVKISSTVTSIGAGIFNDCGSLEEIIVDKNNPVYHSAGNCLIETKKKLLLRGCKNSEIPADGSVTVIGERAFSNNTAHPRNNVHSYGINEIVIPNGITKICKRAFEHNFELESVVFPDTLKTIEKGAFSDCYKLGNIKFGNGVKTIGDEAFAYSEKLKIELVLPDSVTSIGANAFECSAITGVTIGSNVQTVGKSAFWRCKKLKKAALACGEVGNYAFQDCIALEKLNVESTLKSIGQYAFASCTKLTGINFKNGIETIGDGAFSGCEALKSVEIPDSVKYLGGTAFGYCPKLSDVRLPQSVEFMGSNVFKECPVKIDRPKKTGAAGFEIANNALIKYSGKSKDAVIPDGVEKINAKAFNSKKALETITLPASLTSIANKAIEKCANLKSIIVESGNPVYKSAGNCLIDLKKKTVVYGFKDSQIPSDCGITAIAANAFAYSDLETIVIPEGVKTVGASAFKGCKNLKNVIFPKSLKSIGTDAFKYCQSLESVTIPQNVTAISSNAFAWCSSLTEINFNAENCGDFSLTGVFDDAGKNAEGIVIHIGDGVQRIPDYFCGSQSNESVPNVVRVDFAENCVCKRIGIGAFDSCAKIETLKLPDGITEICIEAFDGCTALQNVNIPKSTAVIGSSAFNNCVNLKELIIPAGVTKLSYAFRGCGGLEKIVVEEGNTTYHSSGNCLIGTQEKNLLRGCKNSEIPADGSVVCLDSYSFDKCKDLESIVIPDGVGDISDGVFKNCTKLKSVTIAKTVTYVCSPYFENCSSLECITATKKLLEKYKYFNFKDKVFDLKNRRVEFKFL